MAREAIKGQAGTIGHHVPRGFHRMSREVHVLNIVSQQSGVPTTDCTALLRRQRPLDRHWALVK